MIPKDFDMSNAILDGMPEKHIKIMRNCIDSKLEKIKEERQAHLDELGHRLASIIAEIQAEKREITIMVRDEFDDEAQIWVSPDSTVAIRVE